MLSALVLVALWWLWWVGRSSLLFDEAYYWDWSRRLDLGYFDHPPLVAYIIRLATTIGGSNEFSVRVLMVACGLGTVALAAWAGTLLSGPRAGWLCLAMAATCPLFGILFDYAGPDAPLLLLWAGTVCAVLWAAATGQGRYWYLGGILLGLAMLAKYTAALLFLSLLIYALLSRRRWLFRREPYVAAVLALVVCSPNLWWNARHDWVSITFQSTHGACVTSARTADYLTQMLLYIQNQITLVGPPLALVLAIATIAALTQGIRERDDSMLLLGCCTAVISTVFFVSHGVRHWAAPGYFSAIVSAGVLMARLPHWLHTNRRTLSALVVLVLAAGSLEFAGMQTARIERTTAQDGGTGVLVDTAGRIDAALMRAEPHWKDAARLVTSEVAGLDDAHRRSLVFVADSYGTAGEMAFYLPGHPRVYSGANQYGLWPAPKTGVTTIVYMANETVAGPIVGLPAGAGASAALPVYSGTRLVVRFTVTILENRRTASGSSTLSELIARTKAAPLPCQ
jgi:hypothetical protein